MISENMRDDSIKPRVTKKGEYLLETAIRYDLEEKFGKPIEQLEEEIKEAVLDDYERKEVRGET
jgi:hypothetical protein